MTRELTYFKSDFALIKELFDSIMNQYQYASSEADIADLYSDWINWLLEKLMEEQKRG